MIKSNRRHEALPTGYSLPEIVDPPDTLCVCVPVPDEPAHRAAFLGQMLGLARWYTWEKNDAHTGKDVAEVWMNIWVNVRDQMALQKRNCGCGCAEDQQQRLMPDGTIEISTDGGETWTPATPAQDPRTNGSYLPSIDASTDESKCEAANSATAYFKQVQAEAKAKMDENVGLAQLAAILIGFLAGVGVIATGGALAILFAGLGAILASLDATAWDALFTTEFWEDLNCQIFCVMDDEGFVAQDKVLELATDFYTAHPDRAGQFIRDMLTGMGSVGLSNAIRIGLDGSISCDDCVCTVDCCSEDQITLGTLVSITEEGGCCVMRIESEGVPDSGGFEAVSIGNYGEGAGTYPCCHIFAWTQTGQPITTTGWTSCDGSLHDPGNPETHDVAHAYWSAGVGSFGLKFTVAIVFGTGCT